LNLRFIKLIFKLGNTNHGLIIQIGNRSIQNLPRHWNSRFSALISAYWTSPSGGPASPRKNRKFYAFDPFLFHLFSDFEKGWELSFLRSKNRCDDPAVISRIVQGIVGAEQRRQYGKPTLTYWSGNKEIDFSGTTCIEVKYQNHVSINEFDWAEKVLSPEQNMVVVTKNNTSVKGRIRLVRLEEWLREGE